MRTTSHGLAGAVAVVAMAFGAPSHAQTGYPLIQDTVLAPETEWVEEEWGFRSASLDLANAPESPDAGGKWASIIEMEGYNGATTGGGPNLYVRMTDGVLIALRLRFSQGPDAGYVYVDASIRGTECSGGNFSLYDHRHREDGAEIVEWIADQPWSNGAVGVYGNSYPGQTSYWITTEMGERYSEDPSKSPLKASMPSLLHSDIYRDIFMPGGVQNILFPLTWTYGHGVQGPHRIPYRSSGLEELTGGEVPPSDQRIPQDEICTQHQLTRYGYGDVPQPQDEPIWAGIRANDDDWYEDKAAYTHAPNIKIPYFQQTNWQDEQTGPRAVVLWHHVHPDPIEICDAGGEDVTVIPKKIAVSSGGHGHGGFAGRYRWPFFDIFLRGKCDVTGLFASPNAEGYASNAVENHFESQGDGTAVAVKTGTAWPFPDTTWEKWYLHAEGRLDQTAPTGAEAEDTYLSGIPRPGFFYETGALGGEVTMASGLPDELRYATDAFDRPYVIAGPILMDLHASVVGVDTDFFVALYDVDENGNTSYVQRGLLRASHREYDEQCRQEGGLSYCVEEDAGLLMVQPYRPHDDPDLVFPGQVERYRIEIFPLGHIFRENHRLMVRIMTPPPFDGLWGYTPTHPPAVVSVLHDADHPSWIQLPRVGVELPGNLADRCQVPDGFPCYAPSPLSLP